MDSASSKRTYNQNINSLEEKCLISIIKQFLEKANKFSKADNDNLKKHYEFVRLYLKRTYKVPRAISILEKLIIGLNESHQNQQNQRYWFWELFESYETTQLTLPEIFNSSAWSYKVFQKIQNSTIAFKFLSKVSLSSQLRDTNGLGITCSWYNKYLYEFDQDLGKNLEKFFQNIPNLKVLKLGGFPDDEIVGQIIPKNCSKLASLTLDLNFSNCGDKRRLTDEGICDFIEDSNKTLQHLDLSQISLAPTLSAKSVIALYKLERLTRLELRNSHFEHIEAFKIEENTSLKSLSVYSDFRGEKIDKIILIADKLFTKLNKLKIHQISFQNPKNYSNLELKHLPTTLQSFYIEEIINCESLINNFPNLEEISCFGCAHPFPQSSENWPNLKKFTILGDNFDRSIVFPNLQKMTQLQNFCIISNDLNIKDVKPYLPLTCNIDIETEDMIECSKDHFIDF